MSADKIKLLRTAVADIEKQFGRGSITWLEGASGTPEAVSALPTGVAVIDDAVGIGGFPRGRIIEISGPENSGRSSLALTAIAAAQKRAQTCALIDLDHKLDARVFARYGVDPARLIVSQPDSAEQAFEIIETLVRAACLDLVVADSISGLVSRNTIEGEPLMDGLQARLTSQSIRKICGHASRAQTAVVFVTPTRDKFDAVERSNDGAFGGTALKFYASLRLDMRRAEGGIRVRVVKNKMAAPFRDALWTTPPTPQSDTDPARSLSTLKSAVRAAVDAYDKTGDHLRHEATELDCVRCAVERAIGGPRPSAAIVAGVDAALDALGSPIDAALDALGEPNALR